MRRMKNSELTPALIAKASAILKTNPPMGAIVPFVHEARSYEARLEPHKDEKRGEHKGVSLFIYDGPLVLPPPAARPPIAKQTNLVGDLDGVAFIPTKNYRPGPRKAAVRVVVIHTAECNETDRAAENLAAWLAGPDRPEGASWHYAVDADSITQSVLERDIAWHAGGANDYSIGVEHAGRAKQLEADWHDPYSRTVLVRSAMLVAGVCARHGVPVRRLSPAELVAGEAGICGHSDVNAAFKHSGHWDPGPGFPWALYLELTRNAHDALEPVFASLARGSRGPSVARWQRYLRVRDDGIFGPVTEAATIAMQKAHGLRADGVVDLETWRRAVRAEDTKP